MKDMSITSDGAYPGAGAHGVVLSPWNAPYNSLLTGLRGSIDDSMHVAGDS
jgi:hypothetical protein